jgi:hypothetical protein
MLVNGDEALWYNGTYFSWGYEGEHNYFADQVGIGTTSPAQMLDVNGAIQTNGGLHVSSSSNAISITTAGVDGINIASAGEDGIHIGTCTWDGIHINNPSDNGVEVTSAGSDAIYGNTDDTNHEWGVNTPDKMYAGFGYYPTKMGMYGINAGSGSLQPGDLVCIAGGYEEDALGEGEFSALNVVKANARNSAAIFGVVESKVSIHEKVQVFAEGVAETQKSFRSAEGDVRPGDYLAITVFGPADVKVDSREMIRAGELLAAADGVARGVRTVKVDGVTLAENSGILGKALEDSNGGEKIKVFVCPQ